MGFLTSADAVPHLMEISPQAITDLLVGEYLDTIFREPHGDFRVDWTRFLTTEPADLLYRRAVLEELRQAPAIVDRISDLSKCLSQIRALNEIGRTDYSADMIRDFSLLQLAYSSLEALTETLGEAIADGRIHSQGLHRLYELCSEKLKTAFCTDFSASWVDHASGLEQLGSLLFRFSLDEELHITGAALTAIQKERFVKGVLPSRTLKENRQPDKPWDMAAPKEMLTPLQELIQVQLNNNSRQFFQTLHQITDALEDLHTDLLFYLSALKYLAGMEKLQLST